MDTTAASWERALALLRDEVEQFQFLTWFEPLKPTLLGPDRLGFEVPDQFTINVLRTRFLLMIKNAVLLSFGKEYQIDFYTPGQAPLPAERETESKAFGHGGSDFWSMHNFIERIRGDETADTIDVYEAMDMFLPGLFAFRSILNNGASMDIPNLRDPAQRDQWRNDTACTDPNVAGDQLLPTCKGGTPHIPPSVYDAVREKWETLLAKRETP